jgi:hypothetical protein
MTLPADVTVVVQGPVDSEAQKSTINAIVTEVKRISSGYLEDAIDIPLSCSLAQLMAIRHSREEYVGKLPGIVGLSWTPSTEDSGTVRLWASSDTVMKRAIGTIATAALDASKDEPLESTLVKWPDPCLPFVLSQGTEKDNFAETLRSLPSSVKLSRPDVITDAVALLEGPASDVSTAKREIRVFLEDVVREVQTALVELPFEQNSLLFANDRAILRAVQGACGVVILPTTEAPAWKHTESYDFGAGKKDEAFIAGERRVSIQTAANVLHVEVVSSTISLGSMIVISTTERERDGAKKPFSVEPNEMTGDFMFIVQVPSDEAMSSKEKATWLLSSLKQTIEAVETYGISEVSICIDTKVLDVVPSDELLTTIANVIRSCMTTTKLHTLRRVNIGSKALVNHSDYAGTSVASGGQLDAFLKTVAEFSLSPAAPTPPGFPPLPVPIQKAAEAAHIYVRGLEGGILQAIAELTEKIGL